MNQAILDEALILQAIGYDIILVDGTTKNPGIVKDWPTHQWPESELRIWISRRDDLALALRLGEYVDIEIDAEDETNRAQWEKDFLNQLPPGFVTPSWRSRRGRHWLFKLSDLQNLELASLNAPSNVKGHTLEFRLGFKPAQSLIPTPGNNYRTWVTMPNECEVGELPDTIYQALLRCLPKKPDSLRNEPPTSSERRPGDVFNESVTWEEILFPHGWTVIIGDKWCRPGKHNEVSATTGYCTSENRGELFYCFSTAAEVEPIEPQKAYSKFELWTCLNHGGDFKAAAIAALRGGYSPEVEHHDGDEFPELDDFPELENTPKQESNIASVTVQKGATKKPAKHPRLDFFKFDDPLTAYCMALEHRSAADIGAIWFQCYELFFNFLGRNPHFNWSGKPYYCNGSLFVVGPTATGKKGLSLSAAKAPFNPLIAGEFGDDVEFCNFKNCIAGGFQSGQAILSHFYKDKSEIGDVDKRLIITEQEAGAILKMSKVENSIMSQVMRNAFDGETLEYRVSKIKGAGATLRFDDIQVSMIGHITASELLQLLTTGADKTGELNRVQFILCLDSKFVPESRSNFLFEDVVELAALRERILGCFKWAQNRCIKFSPEIHHLLDDYTGSHDAAMRSGQEKEINARLPLYLRKWIARFAVMDMTDVANLTHWTKALAVIEYLSAANAYLLGEWLDGVDGDQIDKAYLTLKESQGGVTRAALGKELFGNHWSVSKVESVLEHVRQRLSIDDKTLKTRTTGNRVVYSV